MNLDDLKEFLSGLFAVMLFITIFAMSILVIGYFMDKKGCSETAKKLNYNSEFSFWSGCIVTDSNNNKFLLEQLRQIKKD